MKWLKNLFSNNTSEAQESDFIKIRVRDLSVGDVLKSGEVVTDKYCVLDDYSVWCGYKKYTIGKNELIWIKS